MSEVITERRISGKAFIGLYAAAVVAAIVIAVICFMIPPGWFMPLALLPPLGVFIYARMIQWGSTYRLYRDRLEMESGVLSHKIENIELFRVRDVGLRQSLLGRMANFGDIYVHSTDSSTPDLHLRMIDSPREFYEQLRSVVMSTRAQNRTLIVEEGQAIAEP